MRQGDERPLDPEAVATLEAIEAAMSGQVVDPRQAEVAELALLLRDERPQMAPGPAARLDQRVARRFEPGRPPRDDRRVLPRRRRRWIWTPAVGLAGALVVAVVVVVASGGGRRPPALLPAPSAPSRSAKAAVSTMRRPDAAQPYDANSVAASTSSQSTKATSSSQGAFAPDLQTLNPLPSTRKIIQGAQLSLTTPARQVEQVAQEVFNTVGQARGIVMHSTVTATGGPGGYAQFQLSIPSAVLPQTMAALSTLPHARVASRTDNTQDVTNSYQADQRHLADAQALRTSLLKQLAAAVTQGQIDSLTARLHTAESAISSDESTLHALAHQISYSPVTLTINAGAVPVPTAGSGGFTLGRAAHDAGRVLTVAAGIVLIGLAALLPIGLLVALLWWIGARLRHRRRLQALDLI